MQDASEDLERQLSDGVLRLVLNRPDAGNSFNGRMQRDLIDAFEQANGDPEVRVIVLTAAGVRHFCTGPDLRDPDLAPDPERRPGDAARRLREGSQRVVEAMLDCEKPIICGFNGTAAGGGANMVLAADLVIAANTRRSSSSSRAEASFPTVVRPTSSPDGCLDRRQGTRVLRRAARHGRCPATRAREPCASPLDDFESTLHGLVDALATGPTRAYAASKQLLNRAVDDDRAVSFALEAILVEQIASTADVAEGVAAFLERRDARFEGR